MGVVVWLVVGVLMGLGGHQLRPVLQRDFIGGWFAISCYTVGLLLVGPLLLTFYLALGGSKTELGRIVAAFFLAALGVGAGTVAGHYLQSEKED